MALKDVAANLTDEIPWRTCAVCFHLEQMEAGEAAALRALLSNRGVKFSDLAAELAADEDSPSIARDALSRHARGLCAAREALR